MVPTGPTYLARDFSPSGVVATRSQLPYYGPLRVYDLRVLGLSDIKSRRADPGSSEEDLFSGPNIGLGPPGSTPSQTEFAARVTKEVATDLVPTPVWIGGGILVLLLLLYLIL